MKQILHEAKFIIYFQSFPGFATRCSLFGLPESSGGRVRSFTLSVSLHSASSCSYITWGINNRPVWWSQFRDVVSTHRHDYHDVITSKIVTDFHEIWYLLCLIYCGNQILFWSRLDNMIYHFTSSPMYVFVMFHKPL
jgi:hypothetical protein